MKQIFAFLAALLFLSSFAGSVSAQEIDNEVIGERMEKMERDLTMLQRQVSRGGNSASAATGDAGGGDAQLGVRLTAIENHMRTLQGKLEESEFQNRKLSETLDKFQRDTEFRFNELAKTQAAASTETKKTDEKTAAKTDEKPAKPGKADKAATEADATTEGEATDNAADTTSPRELYNFAFRLLNQTQYEKAAAAFESFTKKYPNDPLIGNAFYWQGETYYIRRDFVSAADSFRQGFEAVPNGPKAPDNLLKLAMSLNALNRDKEACIVLGQVITKFKKTSGAVTKKAEEEQKRIECK